MVFIKNQRELLDEAKACNLCLRARETLVRLIEAGIKSADPYEAVRKHLSVRNGKVVVDGVEYEAENIYVVGFGKASGNMARAAEDILGDLITEGIVSTHQAIADRFRLKRIKVIGAGHPIPNENSVKAATEIIELLKKAGEKDLVIVLISGGGSALLEKPADDITLDDLMKTTKLLLRCGATINEINAVRKHISLVKGGKLARYAYPARLVSLIISDVVGDDLSTIASGPTSPDSTTFKDAYNVLVRYGVWNELPETVRNQIKRGLEGLEEETVKPEDPVFKRVRNIIIASNIDALKSMEEEARKLGYNAIILTSLLHGEAREVGKVVASIALEAAKTDHPIPKPAVLLFGGETTVTVKGNGRGGRNQELALSAARVISGEHGVAIASVGSDGIDGATDYAGGIVDAHSIERAKARGLNVDEILDNNDSGRFFTELKDYVYTGATGTNVNDFTIAVVEKK